MRTVLTLDIGNAEIKCGIFRGETLIFHCRMATEPKWTGDQYAAQLKMAWERNSPPFDGAAISSVVPLLTSQLEEAAARFLEGEKKPLIVGPGVKTGLNIRIDNPISMGADFVCGAVGGLEICTPPFVVFDFGTATTLTAVNADGALVGKLIMAGVQSSLDALSEKTACLPSVRFSILENARIQGAQGGFLGKSTVDAMEKGCLHGNAAMVDGLYQQCRDLLGEGLSCILTGGCAQAIAACCKTQGRYEPFLVLNGLRAIWEKNHPDFRS